MIHHTPVLYDEVLQQVPLHARYIADGTLWYGGHSIGILRMLHERRTTDIHHYGLDIDPEVFAIGKEHILTALTTESDSLISPDHCHFYPQSYTTLATVCQTDVVQLDYILLDVGVNMHHFKQADRGFSTKYDGPLDMRFVPTYRRTAQDIIMSSATQHLAQLWEKYGDFSPGMSKKIAEGIYTYRKSTLIDTTRKLVDALQHIGLSDSKIAVIFQCLRIEVNGELDHLTDFMNLLPDMLAEGGVCSLISFHSIEDKIIKQGCKKLCDTGAFEMLSKHVITPTRSEISTNPPSRSAKLRGIRKIVSQ